MDDTRLVSVVIPACNAAGTLDQTLLSVRSQTYNNLEILVVDDGSSDGTADIGELHAAVDRRVRVISQKSAGVAAARNTGWQNAAADWIAFIDADDLWAPTKIERQVAALELAGDRVGLVYCWVAFIDKSGYVIRPNTVAYDAGEVIPQIFERNPVVSGSNPLIRRQALIDAGGYDTRLRAAGAEGCEDHLMCCRVAANYLFAVVPEHLVGYRISQKSMSANRTRMMRSWLMVQDEMTRMYPQHRGGLARGRRRYGRQLFLDALRNREVRQARDLLLLLIKHDPVLALRIARNGLPIILRNMARPRELRRFGNVELGFPARQRFLIGDSCSGIANVANGEGS
jgi:glycosyltransferase involved in cell wall biosynthesis